jgi:uncharacterized membrane protein YoaK (UPF0700 family)
LHDQTVLVPVVGVAEKRGIRIRSDRDGTGSPSTPVVHALAMLLGAVCSGVGGLYLTTHSVVVTALAVVLTIVLGMLVSPRRSGR